MPPPFHPLTAGQFAVVLRKMTLSRRINAVHLHHTWRPRHSDYTGHDTIVGMWRFHTRDRGWRDIAQHLSIAPDGTLWTGRAWEWPPASAEGHNGNSTAGPFMIEMIGNFDRGEDPFKDPQRAAALDTLAHLLLHFKLPPDAIKFHNQMSGKTCPGSSIDRGRLLQEVAARVTELGAAPGDAARSTITPFSEEMDTIYDVLATFSAARRVAEGEEELAEGEGEEPPEDQVPIWSDPAGGVVGSRDIDTVELSPAVLDVLRPHVINLSAGRLTTSGDFSTSRLDVDAIFDEHLPKALSAAKAANRPLRIVLYAHGGLVSEQEGLRGALKHVDWWVRNGVYPLYFVWETGVMETLASLLAGARAMRGLSDFADAQIEALARKFHAEKIWTGMKENARRAVEPDGGGTYTAGKLATFCKAHAADVEVHAAGHSAGAIFHAFLLPVALDAGVPAIATLHYLAPAIRVDTFMQRLSSRLGNGIGPLTMYTMRDTFERADDVGGFYHKSLLYLIHHALEDQRETHLVGLELSVRSDLRLKRLFGITPSGAQALGEVVWSTTTQGSGRSASRSTSHGGFDDDPATMNSVVRRVLNVDDLTSIVEFVRPKAVVVEPFMATPAPASAGSSAAGLSASSGTAASPIVRNRRALCVGINRYRQQPLSGCVADAREWAQTLQALGFADVRVLTDEEATREAILRELQQLVARSTAGDLLVFQFSGHGTTLPDRNADELGGDTPQQDEAICPYDFTEGRFLLDDDLAAVYAGIGDDVGVTNFIDCCHSGSITRFGAGSPIGARGMADERTRFIVADADTIQKHFRFRAATGGRASRGPASMKEVLFAACRSNELAWESNGQGDFTRAATALLRRGTGGLSNQDFETRVIAELGATPRQHPELDCAPAARTRPLLVASRTPAAPASSAPAAAAGTTPSVGNELAVAHVLEAVAALLRK